MSDMLAAFLFGQLEQAHLILSQRRKAHIKYRTLLEPYTEELQIALPYESKDDQPADHMFYILLQDRPTRTQVINLMRDDGIYPTFHYIPLHSAPAAARFQDAPRDCPVTDEISGRLLRLPFYTDISADEQERVVASLVSALRAVSNAPKL